MRLNLRAEVYRQFEKRDTSTDTVTFEGARVKPGTILELTHMSVVDITTLQKELRLGWQDGKGEYHWVEKWISTNQSRQYGAHMTGRLLLVADDRPVARIVTPDDGDEVQWAAFGYVHEIEE